MSEEEKNMIYLNGFNPERAKKKRERKTLFRTLSLEFRRVGLETIQGPHRTTLSKVLGDYSSESCALQAANLHALSWYFPVSPGECQEFF
jgi:hypothetical protein